MTCGAAFQFVLPAWLAAMVQVPAAMSVSAPLDELTEQIVPVVELYVTARPEEAVALTALPVAPTTPVGTAPKVMVWLPLPMVKLWVSSR